MQKAPFLQRLEDLLLLSPSAWTADNFVFFRARVSYLSREQVDRINREIEMRNEAAGKKGEKIALIDVEAAKKARLAMRQALVAAEPLTEEEVVMPEPEEVEVDDTPSDDDDNMVSDSGDLEVVDDEGEDSESGEGDEGDAESDDDEAGDEEEVDIDSMNMDQLKQVATELGIKGVHFFKSEAALREKILATYETSNEAKASEGDQE